MGRRKLKYARSNIRFWHIADSYGLLKVRCEQKADVRYTPKLTYTLENMLSINGANRVFVCIRAIIIVYYSMDCYLTMTLG